MTFHESRAGAATKDPDSSRKINTDGSPDKNNLYRKSQIQNGWDYGGMVTWANWRATLLPMANGCKTVVDMDGDLD